MFVITIPPNMKKHLYLLLILCSICSCGRTIELYDLQCEGLSSPLGIDTFTPHFSWKINSSIPEFKQFAYEIEVASDKDLLLDGYADIWKSGKIISDEQVFVSYRGKSLNARHLYFWRVRVWYNEEKASDWSNIERFSVGIIGPEKLKGKYIGYKNGSIVRKKFQYDRNINYAFLHINSLGYHEAYVNGERISDAVLTPAVSQLDKRSMIVTYDVTSFLNDGENEISIILSPGWYKKQTFNAEYEGGILNAELDINGIPVLWTDGTWAGRESGYKDIGNWRSWQFKGEIIDANIIPESMKNYDLDLLSWNDVDIISIDSIEASQQMCELCRVKEITEATALEPYKDNCWIADMGKVINGMFEISLPEFPKGDTVIISFSDHIQDDGKIMETSRNILISPGKEYTFTNKFNHHVFRYVIIKGCPEKPELSSIKALRMRTDYPRTATFECSDSNMNKIEHMISWTMENLAFDGYMVDCANIERLGYGGDGNASTLSLQTIFDVSPLYYNWLQSWIDVIREDGGLPHTAPCPCSAGGGPYWCSFIIQAPWRTLMNYGDFRLIEKCYPTMKKWLTYVDAWSNDGLLNKWPNTEYRNWYLGDWLAPDGVDVTDEESINLINNCAISQSYSELIDIASYLGLENDKKDFIEKRRNLNIRIHETFFHEESNIYGTGSQIDMVYPLLVGAVPDLLQGKVVLKLKERCTDIYHDHIGVGLVGVPVLAEWATLSGNSELLYKMLSQNDYPGYLYMINNNGTGTWESWDGRRSRLHNCYNGINSWFYQGLGGIRPLQPGYKKIEIKPQAPDGITWMKATKETPYGIISVSWEKEEGKSDLDLSVTIPVGITAIIDGKEYEFGTYNIKYNEN